MGVHVLPILNLIEFYFSFIFLVSAQSQLLLKALHVFWGLALHLSWNFPENVQAFSVFVLHITSCIFRRRKKILTGEVKFQPEVQ